MPLKYKISENDICPSCIRKRPLYKRAKAIFAYNDAISKLIFHFKYYDRTPLAKVFANFFKDHAKEFVDKIDFIIPVPLHKKRLIFRKYNQSALLVKMFGNLVKKDFILDFLIRKKDSVPQVRLKGKNRMQNLKRSFYINDKYMKNLDFYRDKNFLIVDDVMTTGTTVNECTKVLQKSGIENIYVLTIAKTVLGE